MLKLLICSTRLTLPRRRAIHRPTSRTRFRPGFGPVAIVIFILGPLAAVPAYAEYFGFGEILVPAGKAVSKSRGPICSTNVVPARLNVRIIVNGSWDLIGGGDAPLYGVPPVHGKLVTQVGLQRGKRAPYTGNNFLTATRSSKVCVFPSKFAPKATLSAHAGDSLTLLVLDAKTPIIGSSAAPPGWLQHIEWCGHNCGRIEGDGGNCAEVAGRLSADPATLACPRGALVRVSTGLARAGKSDLAFDMARSCQCHNDNAGRTLDANREAVLQWLKTH